MILTLAPEEFAALEREKAQLSPSTVPMTCRVVDEVLRQARQHLLTPREVAGMFGVSERAVRKWCEQGKIMAFQPGGRGGEWRIPADQFAATPEQIRAFRRVTEEIVTKYGGEIDDFER